ncbi:YegS/Rv2252/BmrU family lipid kinase [Sphingomonas sp. HF-S3]|uniref:YegS/Rv2252/BmrU family lipid kinase n=1 Tax=Sphingomonas rustica TaxID=3103142 RepID=A0ABV0B3W2_9SPHN
MPAQPLPREAVLVVNAHSRKGEALFADAERKLKQAGVTLIAAHPVEDPDRMEDTVRGAVRSGAPMVIVGGGDGSLASTVDALVGTDCVFGVLPLGTANSFARTLGLPLELDGAIDAIANGVRRRVDLGMIDDDYFVNGASLGLSPIIGDTIPAGLKRWLGRAGYLLWAVKSSANFRPFRLTLECGEESEKLWATEVRILNGTHHGGVELSGDAAIDSGELLIQVVTGKSRVKLGLDWYAKFFRLRDRDARTREFRGRDFTLKTRPNQRVSIDGEVLAQTPIRARVAAGAVQVAVPADTV